MCPPAPNSFSSFTNLTIPIPAFGAGQVSIIDTPKSLQFKRGTVDSLPASSFGEIFAAALGFAVRGSQDWSALTVVDPFNAPRLAVVVVVSGSPSVVAAPLAGKTTFALTGNGAQNAIEDLDERVPVTQHLNTANAEAKQTKRKPFVALKPESNEDEREYVQQVLALRELAPQISADAQFVTIAVSAAGLQHSTPAAQAEAQKLLQESVDLLARDLKKLNDGQVLVAVALVEEEVQQRQKRQAETADPVSVGGVVLYRLNCPLIIAHCFTVRPVESGRGLQRRLPGRVQHHPVVRRRLCFLAGGHQLRHR